jgi:hypothetical protein
VKRGRRRDKIPPKEIREAFELYLDGTTQSLVGPRDIIGKKKKRNT